MVCIALLRSRTRQFPKKTKNISFEMSTICSPNLKQIWYVFKNVRKINSIYYVME